MKRLEGRTALVTGGNTGIGRAIALAYAREGADVAFTWIEREPEAQSLAGEIGALGRKTLALRCDVTQEADVVAGVAATVKALGSLDILVSNAGIQRPQPITVMSVADWDRMMAVHLRGEIGRAHV